MMEYGLIGEKLGHSFSKIVHSYLADYNYDLKEIKKEDLDAFMQRADFKAINVTIPYKEDVIPYLDFIDEKAQKIGAVNTVVNKDGKLFGYNTDYFGLKALIEFSGVEIKDKKVLILGSGGTSKTAYAVVCDMGAKEVLKVTRSQRKDYISYGDAQNLHNDADVIINATPCGMYPNVGVSPIDIGGFEKLSGVIDAIYNPLCSKLVLEARKRGITAMGGLYMLVSQAVFGVERFLDISVCSEKTKEVYYKVLREKSNIVLVGMPSCGKTTIGKELSKILKKDFLDTDCEIVKKAGMPIPRIFEKFGEEYFRRLESEVIFEASMLNNKIISTGGGAVLNPNNTDNLKGNGIIFFIDRPIEMLTATDDRPLSSNIEDLEKRYKERYNIYLSCADAVIKNDCELENAVEKIKEEFLSENFSY